MFLPKDLGHAFFLMLAADDRILVRGAVSDGVELADEDITLEMEDGIDSFLSGSQEKFRPLTRFSACPLSS